MFRVYFVQIDEIEALMAAEKEVSGMSMHEVLSILFNVIVAFSVPAVGGLILWLVHGRKRKAEDKAVGELGLLAHFKASGSVDCYQRRIR